MTSKDLFTIILKVLGLFFIRDFLALLPQVYAVFLIISDETTMREAIWTFVFTVIEVFVYGLVSYCLIFKTGFVIYKLKLDKGFDQETIGLNIHRSTVLSISIIVIGGLLVVDEIPILCRQLFTYFQQKRLSYGMTHPQIAYSVISAVKIIIGLLLMGNQRLLVNFIERKRK